MVLHMFLRLLVVWLLSCETPEHLGFIQNGRHRDAVWGLTFGHKKPYIIWRPDPRWKGQFWG